MQGVTHAILGAGAGVALALAIHQTPTNALLFVALGTVGGLLPDIDSPHSIISHKARPARLLVFWIKHRGLTHSAGILALLALAGWHYAGWLGLTLAAGYASHLIADMATIEGIPLFYPFKRMIHVLPPGLRLTTGGFLEGVFRLGAAGAVLYGAYKMIPPMG